MTAAPGTKVELFDKDGNKIGEATADENGKATMAEAYTAVESALPEKYKGMVKNEDQDR